MNIFYFFEVLAGPTALGMSIAGAVILSYRTQNQRNPQVRRMLVGLLFWPPLFLFFLMVMHLGHNSLTAYVSFRDGKSIFAFYNYSLLLFGSVVGYQSVQLLKQCINHVSGGWRYNNKLYFQMGRIVITTLPAWIFMPLAPLPTLLMIIVLVISLFTHKKTANLKLPAKSSDRKFEWAIPSASAN